MPADSGTLHEDHGRTRRPGEKSLHKLLELPDADATAHSAGLLAFLQRELSWGSSLGWHQSSSGGKPVEDLFLFFRLPWFLERFLIFGYLLCFDMFLFNLTYLPLRCIAAVYHGGVALLRRMLSGCSRDGGGSTPDASADNTAGAANVASGTASVPSASPRDARPTRSRRLRSSGGGGGGFTRASAFDVLKGVILVAATLMLGFLQISRVYHYIRGEAVIKLYVIFNILEIVDKLCASLGADMMDALYRCVRDSPQLDVIADCRALVATGTRTLGFRCCGKAAAALDDNGKPRGASAAASFPAIQLIFQVALTMVYVCFHAAVIFVQVVCINVAINSRNNALLTLLVSNNFVELKGSVFKRFEVENLFQVSCADAVERFQLLLFFGLIVLQEGCTASAVTSVVTMWCSEIVVDWVKHAFISKFNRLQPESYTTFQTILAHDVLSVRSRMATTLDPTHTCVRRLGMATLPVTCVVLRLFFTKIHPWWFPPLTDDDGAVQSAGVAALVLFFLCVVAGKVLLGINMLAWSAASVKEQRHKLQLATAAAVTAELPLQGSVDGRPVTVTDIELEALMMIERVSAVERYTMHRGKAIPI